MKASYTDHQCELLVDPHNGEVHQTGRYLGDRAIYTCAPGWEIVGPEERVCQSSGRWSNSEPFCKKRGQCCLSKIEESLFSIRQRNFVTESSYFPNG